MGKFLRSYCVLKGLINFQCFSKNTIETAFQESDFDWRKFWPNNIFSSLNLNYFSVALFFIILDVSAKMVRLITYLLKMMKQFQILFEMSQQCQNTNKHRQKLKQIFTYKFLVAIHS